jgi:hypothetical protein
LQLREEVFYIEIHADGTATATVSGQSEKFSDLRAAAAWAESLLYEEGDDSG